MAQYNSAQAQAQDEDQLVQSASDLAADAEKIRLRCMQIL